MNRCAPRRSDRRRQRRGSPYRQARYWPARRADRPQRSSRCGGQRSPPAGSRVRVRSTPLERPLFPFINESDGEDGEEHHHRPETVHAEMTEGCRPRKQETDLEIENDEQNRDQIKSHVKFHSRIVECVKAALIGVKVLRIGLLICHEKAYNKN